MGKAGSRKFKGRTTSRNHKLIQQMLLIQMVATLVISGVLYPLAGMVNAYSALLGGLIYLIPSLYQAKKIFSSNNSNNIRVILRDLYKSEIWKMALTIVLFGIVFSSVKPIEPFPIFGVFILMQLIAWITPLLLNKGRR
ncbi:MAG: ATP synthase subunit I [Motiliproteus sp.]|nr:ATP synthase subunit I [Motiliproteus sp.]MCW9053804.1 ATP synthase subunit I [Motiliproteus sp.]